MYKHPWDLSPNAIKQQSEIWKIHLATGLMHKEFYRLLHHKPGLHTRRATCRSDITGCSGMLLDILHNVSYVVGCYGIKWDIAQYSEMLKGVALRGKL